VSGNVFFYDDVIMNCTHTCNVLPLLFRLLVFSREWTSGGGIGGRLDNEEDEEEARKKYKTMCDGIWSLLPTLVSSPVSR
jgi:hypothetical protein